MNKPDEIPLFPLGIVAYPEQRVPLHIFEDRYKDLVRYCMDNESPFGIVLYDGGRMSQVGCACRILTVTNQYDNGSLDIEARGEDRFRIDSITDDGSYLRCRPDWLQTERGGADSQLVQRMIAQHMKLLELAGRTVRPEFYDESKNVSYLVARNAGLELPQKQELLELDNESDRVQVLIDHMTRFIPKIEQVEEVRRKVQSNGHFTDFPSGTQ